MNHIRNVIGTWRTLTSMVSGYRGGRPLGWAVCRWWARGWSVTRPGARGMTRPRGLCRAPPEPRAWAASQTSPRTPARSSRRSWSTPADTSSTWTTSARAASGDTWAAAAWCCTASPRSPSTRPSAPPTTTTSSLRAGHTWSVSSFPSQRTFALERLYFPSASKTIYLT